MTQLITDVLSFIFGVLIGLGIFYLSSALASRWKR